MLKIQSCAIFHYDEIGLKGENRDFFERILTQNLREKAKILGASGGVKIFFGRGVVDFPKNDEKSRKTWSKILATTPGVANFSFGIEILHENSVEILKSATLENFKFSPNGSFRVSARRAEKNFPQKSDEINRLIGAAILAKFPGKNVKMIDADEDLRVEILAKRAFLSLGKIAGLGGLPISSGGRGLAMLSGGIDSPVAAFCLQKRGVRVEMIHFHAYPQTPKSSLEKVRSLAEKLTKFYPKIELFLVPFLPIQTEILKKTPEKFRVILYRRSMIRIAEQVARKIGAKILITGESVGQVASQTLENIAATDAVATMPILRPLCGMDKREIVNLARKIGTFEISIRAGEDCCTVFLPRRPETRAKIEEVERAESAVELENLENEAVKKMEKIVARN